MELVTGMQRSVLWKLYLIRNRADENRDKNGNGNDEPDLWGAQVFADEG